VRQQPVLHLRQASPGWRKQLSMQIQGAALGYHQRLHGSQAGKSARHVGL
jgi:hypothetical protein